MKFSNKLFLSTLTISAIFAAQTAPVAKAYVADPWEARSSAAIRADLAEINAKLNEVKSSTSDSVVFNTVSVAEGTDSLTYTIKWGDTLSAISVATGISIEDLARFNNIADVNFIKTGNTLVFTLAESTDKDAPKVIEAVQVIDENNEVVASETVSEAVVETIEEPVVESVESSESTEVEVSEEPVTESLQEESVEEVQSSEVEESIVEEFIVEEEVTEEVKPEVKEEVKPVVKEEAKTEAKPVVKEEVKPAASNTISDQVPYIMYQVVQAEAGHGYDEKAKVASVIMNRVAVGNWGGSNIEAVIYAPYQFSVIANGAAQAASPSQETIQAVNDVVLNGYRATSAQSFRASGDGVTNYFY